MAPKKQQVPSIAPATTHTDADGDRYVRYWSVYTQAWRRAYWCTSCPDRDYAALNDEDRALLDALPAQPS